MQTSFVLLVLRKPFSINSVSVTASTSMEPRSDGNPSPAPLLSENVIWEVDEARMVGKRRGGKESLGGGRGEVLWWKVGGVGVK